MIDNHDRRLERPGWTFGKNASFGLWTRALANGKMLILLHSGTVFSRKTTVIYDATVEATGATGGTGDVTSETPKKVKIETKQRIEPTLVSADACGAKVPVSAFPITLFVSGSTVVYTDDALKSFKAFKPLNGEGFYDIIDGDEASAYTLPELDAEIYEDKDETKIGLLVPLYRISVEADSDGNGRVSEVKNVLTADTFQITSKEEDEADTTDDGTDKPEECDDHGDGGTTGSGSGGSDSDNNSGTDGGGGGAGGGASGDETADEETHKACD